MAIMAHSHCTESGLGPGPGLGLGMGTMGFYTFMLYSSNCTETGTGI